MVGTPRRGGRRRPAFFVRWPGRRPFYVCGEGAAKSEAGPGLFLSLPEYESVFSKVSGWRRARRGAVRLRRVGVAHERRSGVAGGPGAGRAVGPAPGGRPPAHRAELRGEAVP